MYNCTSFCSSAVHSAAGCRDKLTEWYVSYFLFCSEHENEIFMQWTIAGGVRLCSGARILIGHTLQYRALIGWWFASPYTWVSRACFVHFFTAFLTLSHNRDKTSHKPTSSNHHHHQNSSYNCFIEYYTQYTLILSYSWHWQCPL